MPQRISAVSRRIAAGCLVIRHPETGLPNELWSSVKESPQRWLSFARQDRISDDAELAGRPVIELTSSSVNDDNAPPSLPADIQNALFKTHTLRPYFKLFVHHWIELEAGVSSDDPDGTAIIVRVYLLPDDVDRSVVSRDNINLRKVWLLLLSRLEYSPSVWRGEGAQNVYLSMPRFFNARRGGTAINNAEDDEVVDDDDDDREDMSLLHLFNTIPSPNPQPEQVLDDHGRDCCYSLLKSDVAGLKTTLYQYQRRSAAVMVQREWQPGKILDPRLSAVVDHNGARWYYDPAAGTVLRDPRHYDGVCGGILAEEMGAGKTLICLSLIMATRYQPALIPEIYGDGVPETRPTVGSLLDMAAAKCARAGVPWGAHVAAWEARGETYPRIVDAFKRNRGYYQVPRAEARRATRQLSRQVPRELPPTRIYLSRASLVVVPNNLLQQWQDEIAKHTSGLQVLVLGGGPDERRNKGAVGGLPDDPVKLLGYELILCSFSCLERFLNRRTSNSHGGWELNLSIARIRFKRVIVDEGHRLGNSRMSSKSNLLLILEHIHADARWIVTGTPSTGLFGVDTFDSDSSFNSPSTTTPSDTATPSSFPVTPIISQSTTPIEQQEQQSMRRNITESSDKQEKKDLERIGAIASLYLNVRPWANTALEPGDTPADWSVYVMQPRHSGRRSAGRSSVLRSTLESLMVRHRKSEIGDLLPRVSERTVLLDGSYQDRLALNLFSMMIIFNSVQSQRTDQDFFFHPRQRKNLLLLASNLRQASFFGGVFFSREDIAKSVQTAAQFLEEKKFTISDGDDRLLRDAIAFGEVAAANELRDTASRCHEVPAYVRGFPGGEYPEVSKSWSLMGEDGDPVCIDAPMLHALQRYVRKWLSSPMSLAVKFKTGKFAERGREHREDLLEAQLEMSGANKKKNQQEDGGNQGGPNAFSAPSTPSSKAPILAGNTKLGDAGVSHAKPGSAAAAADASDDDGMDVDDEEIAEPLARARLISTASAKMSYLLDQIMRYREQEKIIVFYESDNVAYYIAGFLEVLHVPHLIYAKSLSTTRRAQYSATFNQVPKFRVMLMDLTQAAFGLDIQCASRIYFVNPVLNPQVEAQAIGRARRIGQERDVIVETLVLKGSLEEVIVERKTKMTQAEHRQCRSILDDRPIFDWFLNARILPLPDGVGEGRKGDGDGEKQMAPLANPLPLFGRGTGRVAHPDEDLVDRRSSVKPGDDGTTHVAKTAAVADGRDHVAKATERTGNHHGGLVVTTNGATNGHAAQQQHPIAATVHDDGGGLSETTPMNMSSKRPFEEAKENIGNGSGSQTPAETTTEPAKKKKKGGVRFADDAPEG